MNWIEEVDCRKSYLLIFWAVYNIFCHIELSTKWKLNEKQRDRESNVKYRMTMCNDANNIIYDS